MGPGTHQPVGLGTSLFLIAVGAILRFAITVSSHTVNVQTIGLILMIVGGMGLIISIFYMVISTTDRRPLPREDEVAPPRVRDPGPRY